MQFVCLLCIERQKYHSNVHRLRLMHQFHASNVPFQFHRTMDYTTFRQSYWIYGSTATFLHPFEPLPNMPRFQHVHHQSQLHHTFRPDLTMITESYDVTMKKISKMNINIDQLIKNDYQYLCHSQTITLNLVPFQQLA